MDGEATIVIGIVIDETAGVTSPNSKFESTNAELLKTLAAPHLFFLASRFIPSPPIG